MIQLELQFIDKPKRECLECGGNVVGQVNKVYCSKRCKQKVYYQANLERYSESRKACRERRKAQAARYRAKRYCPVCGKEVTGRTHRVYCSRKCIRQAYSQANREKLKAYCHLRRARKKANGVEPSQEYRNTMVNPLTHQVCRYCGTDCTGNHHWDHHIPIAAGGPDAPWNLVIACPTCNMSKGAKVPASIFCEEIFKNDT